MRFFTHDDLTHAIAVMLAGIEISDMSVRASMNGIKRRARARAIVDFGKKMTPAPPDYSITTMDKIFHKLFHRSISKNTLHEHFATPGRKADDRVDVSALYAWFDEHRERFEAEAGQLLADLELEWREFTHNAAVETGKIRREEGREQRRDMV